MKETKVQDIHDELVYYLNELRKDKPSERSEIARRYAVAITELEKAIAYLRVYIVDELE